MATTGAENALDKSLDGGVRYCVQNEKGEDVWMDRNSMAKYAQDRLDKILAEQVGKMEQSHIKTFVELKVEYKELTGKNPRPMKREQLEAELQELINLKQR